MMRLLVSLILFVFLGSSTFAAESYNGDDSNVSVAESDSSVTEASSNDLACCTTNDSSINSAHYRTIAEAALGGTERSTPTKSGKGTK